MPFPWYLVCSNWFGWCFHFMVWLFGIGSFGIGGFMDRGQGGAESIKRVHNILFVGLSFAFFYHTCVAAQEKQVTSNSGTHNKELDVLTSPYLKSISTKQSIWNLKSGRGTVGHLKTLDFNQTNSNILVGCSHHCHTCTQVLIYKCLNRYDCCKHDANVSLLTI